MFNFKDISVNYINNTNIIDIAIYFYSNDYNCYKYSCSNEKIIENNITDWIDVNNKLNNLKILSNDSVNKIYCISYNNCNKSYSYISKSISKNLKYNDMSVYLNDIDIKSSSTGVEASGVVSYDYLCDDREGETLYCVFTSSKPTYYEFINGAKRYEIDCDGNYIKVTSSITSYDYFSCGFICGNGICYSYIKSGLQTWVVTVIILGCIILCLGLCLIYTCCIKKPKKVTNNGGINIPMDSYPIVEGIPASNQQVTYIQNSQLQQPIYYAQPLNSQIPPSYYAAPVDPAAIQAIPAQPIQESTFPQSVQNENNFEPTYPPPNQSN